MNHCEWCAVSPLWVFTAMSPAARGCYGPRFACAAHREKVRRLTKLDSVECEVTPIVPLPPVGDESDWTDVGTKAARSAAEIEASALHAMHRLACEERDEYLDRYNAVLITLRHQREMLTRIAVCPRDDGCVVNLGDGLMAEIDAIEACIDASDVSGASSLLCLDVTERRR